MELFKYLRQICISATSALCLAVALVTLAPTSAQADGAFRWQNDYNGWYLEVWLSSTANGAPIITYPYNASSANQIWSDFQLSDSLHFRLMNNNSWKALDFLSSPIDEQRCGITRQYDWVSYTSQWWQFRYQWDRYNNRDYVLWVSLDQCNGNPYHNVLGGDLIDPDYNYRVSTWLWTQELCSDQRYGPPSQCYWKRDGQ